MVALLIGGFLIPLAIIFVSYLLIFIRLRRRKIFLSSIKQHKTNFYQINKTRNNSLFEMPSRRKSISNQHDSKINILTNGITIVKFSENSMNGNLQIFEMETENNIKRDNTKLYAFRNKNILTIIC